MKRAIASVAVLAAVFVFGMFTANYKTFPWTVLQPAGQQIAALMRSAGILPPLPEQNTIAEEPERLVKTINTQLVNFDLAIVNNAAERPESSGGGTALTRHGVLIGKRVDGVLQLYDPASDVVRNLPFVLPSLEADAYPDRFPTGRSVPKQYIRYHDVEVLTRADGEHLFVSYNRYDAAANCFSMRLSEALLPADWQIATGDTLEWRTVFDTVPCLPPSNIRNTFGGNQAGGRILPARDGGFYLTVGDFEFDGVDGKGPAVSQLEGASYGRILHFDDAGTVNEVVRGLRNPQGLAYDASGKLWATDQSAQGGDELDLIVAGRNYGWPEVSLGVMYAPWQNDDKNWPFNKRQGWHQGYDAPRHAWLPSVAPSSLALVTGISDRWEGDLIASTLASGSLRRLRLEGENVIYDENIPLDRRTRDILVADGRIYLLFDDGRFGYLTAHAMQDTRAAAPTTTTLADFGCIECHSSPTAPRLSAIWNRDIASQSDITYSQALTALEGNWSAEKLRAFITSPSTFASGTTMPNPGLTAEQAATVVEELRAINQSN
jgi:cytochrome c2